jgi:hypothetical protein
VAPLLEKAIEHCKTIVPKPKQKKTQSLALGLGFFKNSSIISKQ